MPFEIALNYHPWLLMVQYTELFGTIQYVIVCNILNLCERGYTNICFQPVINCHKLFVEKQVECLDILGYA